MLRDGIEGLVKLNKSKITEFGHAKRLEVIIEIIQIPHIR